MGVEQLPDMPVTTWTPQTLSERLGRKVDDVEDALDTAGELLDEMFAERWRNPPQGYVDQIVRRLVRAILDGDSRQFTGPSSTQVEAGRPVAAPRDPREAVMPLVRPYVQGFA